VINISLPVDGMIGYWNIRFKIGKSMRYKKIRHFRFLLVILLGLFSGCWLVQQESVGNGSSLAELLRNGVYGTRTLQKSSATWITNHTALEHVYSALNKRQLKDGEALPDIDFETYGVLFLEMGQKPTGGYAIDFTPSLSRVIDKQAVISISWNTPEKGVLLTQAVTSPFMLLKIYRADIISIAVLNQDEQPLFEIPIK
jgi:hypothetical protein